MEMKLVLAAIYKHYRTRTTPSATPESMSMDDQLTSAVPYALKCELEFIPREEVVSGDKL
jgi:hypothetical protein